MKSNVWSIPAPLQALAAVLCVVACVQPVLAQPRLHATLLGLPRSDVRVYTPISVVNNGLGNVRVGSAGDGTIAVYRPGNGAWTYNDPYIVGTTVVPWSKIQNEGCAVMQLSPWEESVFFAAVNIKDSVNNEGGGIAYREVVNAPLQWNHLETWGAPATGTEFVFLQGAPRATLALFADGIHISQDDGRTWRRKESGSFDARSLCVLGDGTAGMELFGIDQHADSMIVVSTDTGTTVSRRISMANPEMVRTRITRLVAVLGALYVQYHEASRNGSLVALAKSLDAGRHWQRLITMPSQFLFTAKPERRSWLYLAHADSLLCSTDGGSRWHVVTHDIPDPVITSIAAEPLDHDALYLLNSRDGKIYVVYGSLTAADEAARVPALAEIGAPYPNPAHDAVTLPVQLPSGARVSLTLHDMLGREVGRIAAQDLHAGAQAVSLPLGGHAPGAYTLHITIGTMRTTRIVLVR